MIKIWKVLIVDDEPKIRKGLRSWIKELNLPFDIIGEASNYNEALEECKKNKPHLLLVDINMPGINGLNLIEQLKSKNYKSIIIIVSGYDDFVFVRQALRLQVYDYLLKPVPKGDFYRIMKKVNEELADKFQETNLQKSIGDNVNTSDDDKNYSAIVLRVKKYIDDNYQDEEINLSDVAKFFNINKTYLSKLMKQELGNSFVEYLTEVRITRAKELLLEDTINIKMYEIAKKVGYKSQHYFSRVFKKSEGENPLEYKNKIHEKIK